jgi:hypothetical protein
LEGSGRGLNEVLSQHLSGGTEGEEDQPQSRQAVSQPRFEPRKTSPFHMKIMLIKFNAEKKFKSEVEV